MANTFLGLLPWAPGGHVSAQDERAEAAALVNPFTDGRFYLHDLADTADWGDEHHETNTFAYIPTEMQVAAALAALNMQTNATITPVQYNDPSLSQLSQSLYAQASQLWQEIAAADTEGWDV